MKILLLSDIPPCENLTAGLVLSAMVRFLPRDSVFCFIVANPTVDIRMTPEFANIPVSLNEKPNENWSWLPQGRLVRRISAAVTSVGELFVEKVVVPRLVARAVDFGRQHRADRVWAVLQGQTTIRMAKAVAEGLGIPLHTHVWDPFSWWARANGLDRITTRRVQKVFDDAIRFSESVATASEPMADRYRKEFGVRAVPVVASHSRSMARHPDTRLDSANQLLVGMAGQFYASAEWLTLLKALDAANWTIGGRSVRVVAMGPQRPPGAETSRVVFLGWKAQADAATILSCCDVLYCPYPFDPVMKEVSQYSFPSKLVLYLAAGRPIVFHGPAYSSPVQYIRERRCGVVADRPLPTAIFNEIERLVGSPSAYAEAAKNAQQAFTDDFTLESMGRSMDAFIVCTGNTAGSCAALHNHAGVGEGASAWPLASKVERGWSIQRRILASGRRFKEGASTFRRALRGFARSAAFWIPQIRSMHHQIKQLLSENEALSQRNAQLQLAIGRVERQRSNTFVEAGASSGTSCTSAEGRLRAAIALLLDGERGLLLTEAGSEGVARQAGGHADCPASVAIEMGAAAVDSAFVMGACRERVAPADDWRIVRGKCSEAVLARLLRFVLTNETRRLLVFNRNLDLIALTLALGELSSLPVTIICDRNFEQDRIDWLSGREGFDVKILVEEDAQ